MQLLDSFDVFKFPGVRGDSLLTYYIVTVTDNYCSGSTRSRDYYFLNSQGAPAQSDEPVSQLITV